MKSAEKSKKDRSAERSIPEEKLEELNLKLATVIEDLLTELGFDWDSAYVTESHIRGSTFCHDGDNGTGFIYYHNMNRWACFTNNCHKQYFGDPIGLIRCIMKVGFKRAVEIAEEFVANRNISDEQVAETIKKRKELREQAKRDGWVSHLNQKTYSEWILDRLSTPAPFCRHRQFDTELFQRYRIGYAKTGKMVGRIVCPIRNVHGRLVGFTGRIVNREQAACKWLHVGFERSLNFFNLDNAFDHLCQNGGHTMVLVEGPFDALRLVQAGIKNVVAIFGVVVTPEQIRVLKKIGISKVLLALDGGEAGHKGAALIKKILEKEMLDVCIIRVEDELSALSFEWDSSWGEPDWGHERLPIGVIQKVFAGRDI